MRRWRLRHRWAQLLSRRPRRSIRAIVLTQRTREVFRGARRVRLRIPPSTCAGPLTERLVGWNPFSGRPIVGGNAIVPDCFLCCTGTNDIGNLANDRTSIADVYFHLVDYMRERCGDEPSIGFIVPTASASPGVDHQALFDRIYDVCARANCFMIDLWHELGSHGDDRFGYDFDGLHPNDRGHAAGADYVARWMLQALRDGTARDEASSPLSSAG